MGSVRKATSGTDSLCGQVHRASQKCRERARQQDKLAQYDGMPKVEAVVKIAGDGTTAFKIVEETLNNIDETEPNGNRIYMKASSLRCCNTIGSVVRVILQGGQATLNKGGVESKNEATMKQK